MKKFVLFIAITILFPLIFAGSMILYIIQFNNVSKLKNSYPIYSKKINRYTFQSKRPSTWTSINAVSNYAKWAIVVSEDWAFYDHPGVDLNQLKITILESIDEGEFTRGASTITQQLIKNSVLSDERTLWRKFQEIVLALYLEKMMTKDEILEKYLNIIELGDGIYGIGPAAKFYFDKSPERLNAREGAFLAMLLPSPVKYSVSFHKKELTEFAKARVEDILIKLRQANIYDEQERLNQRKKKFYWEEDFYQSSPEMPSEGYDDYLDDTFF
tara:strand:- start:3325 stop:4137 length:813 start_codon:yes stop_codon:yes gene_type:complete